MNKNFIEIAKFTKPQGLRGDLRAVTYCDCSEQLDDFERFYTEKNGEYALLDVKLKSVRKGFVIMKIHGVDDLDNALVFVGQSLYVSRDDFQLPENTWFICDLLGLEVVDADSGKVYGVVADILQNAPKDVYVVKTPDNAELLFPAIPEVLIDVDITAGKIKIRPLPGLFEDSQDSDDPDAPEATNDD